MLGEIRSHPANASDPIAESSIGNEPGLSTFNGRWMFAIVLESPGAQSLQETFAYRDVDSFGTRHEPGRSSRCTRTDRNAGRRSCVTITRAALPRTFPSQLISAPATGGSLLIEVVYRITAARR